MTREHTIPFSLYLHGVPKGQDVCGPADDRPYVEHFYSNSSKPDADELLVTDVRGGKSFYTYMRCSVVDCSGRPGSYFGLTLVFPGRRCCRTKLLAELLGAFFRDVCTGSLLAPSGREGLRFLVSSVGEAMYKGRPLYDVLGDLTAKNLAGPLAEAFVPLEDGAASNSAEPLRFSLDEVDSPFYVQALLTHRLWLSAAYPTAAEACRQLRQQNGRIAGERDGLRQEKKQLEQERNELTEQLRQLRQKSDDHGAAAEAENKKLRARAEAAEGLSEQLKDDVRRMAARFPAQAGGGIAAVSTTAGRPVGRKKIVVGGKGSAAHSEKSGQGYRLTLRHILVAGLLLHALTLLLVGLTLARTLRVGGADKMTPSAAASADSLSPSASASARPAIPREPLLEGYSIDVKELSRTNPQIERNKVYTLSLKRPQGIATQSAPAAEEWSVESGRGSMKELPGSNGRELHVYKDASDSVVVACRTDGGVVRRSLTVKP